MKYIVIIPTWKRGEILHYLEKRLIEDKIPSIWVGDSGNYNIKSGIYIKTNKSFVESLNIGLKKAIELGYDWAIFLDDDAIPNKSYFKSFEELHTGKVCIGGSALTKFKLSREGNVYDIKIEHKDYERPKVNFDGSVTGKHWRYYPDKLTEVDHLMGCNWAINLEIIKKHNIEFDEKLSRLGFRSETDFQTRLKKLGYKIYFHKDLHVFHMEYKLGSFSEYEKNNYWRGYDHARFAIKNFGKLKSLIGILFTNLSSPRPIWQLPILILKDKDYIYWYTGFFTYFFMGSFKE